MSRRLIELSIVALVALGCERAPTSRGTVVAKPAVSSPDVPHGTGGGPVGVEVATDDIVAARCDYEARCGNVGPGVRFRNRQDCLAVLAAEVVDQLDSDHCPNGLAGQSVQTCIEAARTNTCASALEPAVCGAPGLCANASGD